MTYFKRLSALVFSAFFAICILSPAYAAARPLFAAVTVDARTGVILFDDNSTAQRQPASLTKMMTLYIVFQEMKSGRLKLSTPLKVSGRAAAMPPSKLGLKPGTTITVKDAVMALIIKSANDVAAIVGENLGGGSEAAFGKRMTEVAKSLGMNRTTFKNASGLPNSQQVTTARDMATLGLRLMRDFPQYYPYFRATSYTIQGRTIRTHNRLVGRFPGTDGIKTGYIRASGFNLVTSTKRGEKRLVGVVLGGRSASSRNAYMMTMLNKSFAKARDGRTVAALAGSGKGAIDPIANVAAIETPAATAPQAAAKAVAPDAADNAELAAAVATAADEPDLASTEEPEEGAGEPTVLEAALTEPEAAPAKQVPQKLPFAVKAPATQEDVLTSSLPDGYSVQIGKFDTKKSAQAAIAKVRIRDAKSASTVAVKKDGKVFYRVLVSGYGEKSARLSCALAVKLGKDCVILSPQG